MPNEQGLYSRAERDAYESPPCPQCGGPTVTTWIPAGGLNDPPDHWLPGTYRCLDRSCVSA